MKTILLLNHSPAAIKLYEVFDGLDKALEALCAIYEEHLLMPFHDIRMYPARISYRYGDLMRFLNKFEDLVVMVQVAGDQPAFRALTSDDLENSFERFLRNQIV